MSAPKIPNATESEREILGACLVGRLDFRAVQEQVDRDDLYQIDHRELFEAMAAQLDANGEIDGPLLMSRLEGDALATAGDLLGGSYLLARSYQQHLAEIRDTAQRRRLMAEADAIYQAALSAESSEEAISDSQGRMLRLAAGQQTSGPVTITEAMREWLEELEERVEDHGDRMGIPTGFPSLDQTMGAMEGGELVVVAGRPGMGKTTLAMNIAENAMLRDDRSVLVFSLEMPRKELVNRMASSISALDMAALKKPQQMGEVEWAKVSQAIHAVHDKPMRIDDTGALHVQQLRARARVAHQQQPVQMIIVDYLGLLRADGRSLYEQVTEISGQLKALAKELDVPVIALSQLNRAVDKRPTPIPQMSDLRDSGSIEQDADKIVFLYRPAAYPGHEDEGPEAQVIVAKNRQGETGTCRLNFQGQYNRFREVVTGYEGMEGRFG
ncbi:replicative DNA helicase [Thioalkalivibrio sp. ALE12]|uniref:replicative DNA helicase n=1 Tax=Thioalkalivibrio sp. ALE12 TaxID=1158170 RepID=UPI0003741E6E|nr:replicative DNA helicase [Thioalkalivibrio sp. ALE12]